ncbi:MAG: sulfite exporter TauE/SafE family protein [Actinobacteria bacterium]|nr:sulfite exporter TauE/SafE family protein [Actinomycetota bacterium]MCG2806961.1 sulfite exporter TauE/SafE family protein [Coriobacteriia bacterium]
MLALFISMLTLGLVTSVHCVSMCGPMVVTYAVKGEEGGPWQRKLVPNLAYQLAKITSYVIVGLALGAIGSAFNIDGVRPYIMLVAGAFMIIMGLGMTGKFPWAARLSPRPPKFLMTALSKTRRKANADAEAGESTLATPISFGLLTGLMPCAPLMAAQLAAAGTGSVLGGGVAMLAFGIGTSPLMLIFGTASSLLPKQLKQKMMSVLAVVVILFGGMYLNRAAMRLGSPITLNTAKQAFLGAPAGNPEASASFTAAADGVVEVPLTIQNTQFSPSLLQIPADKPVRLLVDRKEDNACSDQLSIPQLGVTVDLKPNDVTIVELPASKAGQYTLTCGMGMMSGQLSVGTGVASGQPGSPLPWALFTFASASGAMWVGRGLKRTPKSAPSRRQKAAFVGLSAKQTGLAIVLVGFVSLLGFVLSTGVR